MVVFINGLPLVVMELKNQFTGQTVEHAMNQFKKDRDPKEQLFTFNEPVIVYFAVDPDEVFMATGWKSQKHTFYLSIKAIMVEKEIQLFMIITVRIIYGKKYYDQTVC